MLILSRDGASDGLSTAKQVGCAVWVGSDVFTDEEYRQYGEGGLKISRFIYSLSDGDPETLEDALQTIEAVAGSGAASA